MTKIQLPWGAWYGDEVFELAVPEAWRVSVPAIRNAPPLSAEAVRQGLRAPIGTRPLRELAAGKRSAAIVVDDLTRPTPTAELLPLVLEELRAGGLSAEAVRVLVGQATHRPMARPELFKKLGPLVDDLTVISHNPYENLVPFGTTKAGTPVAFSRFYVESDLRLTIGCVEPHGAFGHSGGAKLIFPGLAGIDSIYANHRPNHLRPGILAPEASAMRLDAEEAVRMVGLDAVVNVVVGHQRQILGIFVGDFVATQRKAAVFAEQVYATPVAGPADAVLLNAYPKDTELIQVINAANALFAAKTPVLRDGGVAVIATAASEGPGYHALAGPGGRMSQRSAHPLLAQRPIVLFCPHGRTADLPPSLPAGTVCCREWPEVVRWVEARVGPSPSLTAFTEGCLQIPVPVQSPAVQEPQLAGAKP
jgi:nickel-dependent lactate racemase